MKYEIETVYLTYEKLSEDGERMTVHHELRLDDCELVELLRKHMRDAAGEVTISTSRPDWCFM